MIGEFKFIHIFLFPLIFLSFKNFKKNNKDLNILNLIIIFSVIAFFFNQLITANQIYIFSLIPVLAAVIHVNLNNLKIDPKVIYIIIFIALFATVKFHLRFNVERKFHELNGVNFSHSINASKLEKKLSGLKFL